MNTACISYKRHCFPLEIIAHAVLLYARFNLNLREIEEMLLARGIDVSYGTVRRWMVNCQQPRPSPRPEQSCEKQPPAIPKARAMQQGSRSPS